MISQKVLTHFLTALLLLAGIVFGNDAGLFFAQNDQEMISEPVAEGMYQVVRVIDGDTIEVEHAGQKNKVRLVGVNTPESVDPRKGVECFGKAASAALTELLLHQQVTLEPDPTQADRDRYGRLLRFVFLDGQDVGMWLLAEGYAQEALYSDIPHQYRDAYLFAQKQAQEQGKGMWADGVCDVGNEGLEPPTPAM